jgi:hypothetical protein
MGSIGEVPPVPVITIVEPTPLLIVLLELTIQAGLTVVVILVQVVPLKPSCILAS